MLIIFEIVIHTVFGISFIQDFGIQEKAPILLR